MCLLFSQNPTHIKLDKCNTQNLDEIAIATNVYLYEHFQKTNTLFRYVSCFLDMYYLRLSEASSFCRKKYAQ